MVRPLVVRPMTTPAAVEGESKGWEAAQHSPDLRLVPSLGHQIALVKAMRDG